VRRIWPDSIIAWRRLLEGRLRDPLVGRDALFGGALVQSVLIVRLIFPKASSPPNVLGAGPLESISGTANWASSVLDNLAGALVASLWIITFVVIGRILLRKNWVTWLVLTGFMVILLTTATASTGVWGSPLRIAIAALMFAIIWGTLFFTVIRFGLLALVFSSLYSATDNMMSVMDPGSWFFGYVLAFVILILVVPALWAFWISLGDTKLLRTDLLDG
jgi:hypothetical protein